MATTEEPTFVMETRSLHRKLAQVMYEADTIPKNGVAPQAMGGFRFVQVGDAADAIRKALAEKNVSMIPSNIELISESEHATSSGKMMTTMTVRTTWTLTDGESGETAVIQSMGSGADMGDKAVPKAQTNAMKYALLMGFLLSTGDDPERSDSSDRQARPTPTPASVNAQERERLAASQALPTPADLRGLAPEQRGRSDENGRSDGDGSLIGTVEIAKDSPDFLPHIGPDGAVLTFKLVSPAGGIKVIAKGDLATILSMVHHAAGDDGAVGQRVTIVGQRVSCWGRVRDETFTKPAKGNTKAFTSTYQVLDLERIKGPDFILPAPDDIGPEPPDDVPLFDEAESEPMGLVG